MVLWPVLITTFVTNIHTHGHGDSMTDPAQRAGSVKIMHLREKFGCLVIMMGFLSDLLKENLSS